MATYDPRHTLGGDVTGNVNTADQGRARLQVRINDRVVLDVLVPHEAATQIKPYQAGARPDQDTLLEALVAASDPSTLP